MSWLELVIFTVATSLLFWAHDGWRAAAMWGSWLVIMMLCRAGFEAMERRDRHRGSLREADRELARLYRPGKQNTYCWCPGCRNDLVSQGPAFQGYDASGLVKYRCGECGNVSRWLFDAPCPLLIDDGKAEGGTDGSETAAE